VWYARQVKDLPACGITSFADAGCSRRENRKQARSKYGANGLSAQSRRVTTTQGMGSSAQDSRRSGFRKATCTEIYFEHDVRRQARDGASHLYNAWIRSRRRRTTIRSNCQESDRNCKAVLEVKTRRVGGQLSGSGGSEPVPQQSLAIHWLVLYSRTRSGKTDGQAGKKLWMRRMPRGAVKKKEDVHRMRKRTRLSRIIAVAPIL